jgi:hypothetical protein
MLPARTQAEEFEALVRQWLASIPAVDAPAPVALPQIVPLPFRFPERPVVEEVRWGAQALTLLMCPRFAHKELGSILAQVVLTVNPIACVQQEVMPA